MNWSESGENYEKTKTHRNKIGFDSDFCDRRIVSIQNRQTDEQEEKMNESRIHSNGMKIPMRYTYMRCFVLLPNFEYYITHACEFIHIVIIYQRQIQIHTMHGIHDVV